MRLVVNLLDGALARRTARIHPRGELYNELGDRLTDIAFLVPVAFLPGADRTTVLLGVAGAIFASFAGVVPRAAGGERIYRGILSKPGRMILLSVFAVAVFIVGPEAWGPFGPPSRRDDPDRRRAGRRRDPAARLMPIDGAPAILVIGSAAGLIGASAWAIFRRLRPRPGLSGQRRSSARRATRHWR